MADDPVWPDPFRPRIVAPAKGKKKREKPHDALAMHESRYHADYLREIFNPFALNIFPNIFKYTLFHVPKNVQTISESSNFEKKILNNFYFCLDK